VKKADLSLIREKIGTLVVFFRVSGIFLSNTQLGPGSYARAMLSFKIQVFILIHFTSLAAQDAAKEQMTECDRQKYLSNNANNDL